MEWTEDSIIESLLSSHNATLNSHKQINLTHQTPPLSILKQILITNNDSRIVFLVGCYILKYYTKEMVDSFGFYSIFIRIISWIPGVRAFIMNDNPTSLSTHANQENITFEKKINQNEKESNEKENHVNKTEDSNNNMINESLKALNQLCSFGSTLNSEGLDILQTTFEAALNINQIDFATDALELLKKNPIGDQSSRYKMLLGLYFECIDDFDEAISIYQEILEEKPFYKDALKRYVAISKSLGALDKAIKWLNHYLTLHPMDLDARIELVDLYSSVGQYTSANISAEELILLQPNNWMFHLKYADTLCRCNQYNLARKHYAKSFNIKETLRGALGLLTCLRYDDISKNRESDEKLKKLLDLYIVNLYAEAKSPFIEIIKESLIESD